MTIEHNYIIAMSLAGYEIHGPFDSLEVLCAYGNWLETEVHKDDESWNTWHSVALDNPRTLPAINVPNGTPNDAVLAAGNYVLAIEERGYSLSGPCADVCAVGEAWEQQTGSGAWFVLTLASPDAPPRVVTPTPEMWRAALECYDHDGLHASIVGVDEFTQVQGELARLGAEATP